jgi:AraC-like DNA-binding protein
METTLIYGIFMSLMLSALLLTKKGRNDADNLLSVYLLISALSLALAYLEIINRESGYNYPFLINSSVPFILLLGPTLWLYVKRLITPGFRYKRVHLLLLTPFFIAFILLFLNSYSADDTVKIASDRSESFHEKPLFLIIASMIALSNIGYIGWGLSLISAHRKRIKSYFSQTEKIDLRWLKFLLIWALICYSVISLLYLFDSFVDIFSYNSLQTIGYAIASVFVIILGFFGLRQGDLFSGTNRDYIINKPLEVTENREPIAKQEEEFINRLLSYMKESKPYLNPEITLGVLSSQMKVSSEYLSRVINTRLNMNFFDFIAHYRVEEFKHMCKDLSNRNYTIISLAYDCGFNSKAAFNRVFKKTTGVTPSEYYLKVK